jgi:DNA-binding NarL/FixJ family response regulator
MEEGPARLKADLAGTPSLWRDAEEKVASLTSRELQVLTLMAEGLSSPEIGTALGISARTVDIFRGKLLRKLDVKTGTLAVRVAVYAALAQRNSEDT